MPFVVAAAIKFQVDRTADLAAGGLGQFERELGAPIRLDAGIFVVLRVPFTVIGPVAIGRVVGTLRPGIVFGNEPVVTFTSRVGIDTKLVLGQRRVQLAFIVGREVACNLQRVRKWTHPL